MAGQRQVNAVSLSAQVFVKTPLGSDALVSDRAALPPPARQLLILVDGKRSIGELESLFGQEPVRRFLPLLQQKAYVEAQDDMFGPATVAAAPAPAAAPAAAPAQTPALTAVGREPAARLSTPAVVLLIGACAAALGFGAWRLSHADRAPEAPETVAATDASAAASAPESAPAPASTPESPAPAPASPVGANVPASASDAEGKPSIGRPAAPALGTETAVSVPPARPAARKPADTVAAVKAAGTPAAPAAPTTAPPVRPVAASPVVVLPHANPVATVEAAGAGSDTATTPGPATGAAAPATLAAGSAGTAAAPSNGSAAPAANAVPVALHARNRTLPMLPRRARRADITSGKAVVRLYVTAGGTVDKVELVSAKPAQVYDDQVASTLMQWTFDPPGQATQTTVELDFAP